MKTITQITIGNNHLSVSRISARFASICDLYASTSDCARKHSHPYDDSYWSKQEGSEAGLSFAGIMIGTIAILLRVRNFLCDHRSEPYADHWIQKPAGQMRIRVFG